MAYYKKEDIFEEFYELVGESQIKFISESETERYMYDAFKRCYPEYHTKMRINYDLKSTLASDTELEVPKGIRKIAEIILLKNSDDTDLYSSRTFYIDDQTLYKNVRLTDWQLVPDLTGAKTRYLLFRRPLPIGTIRIYAQAELDFYNEDVLEVPSIEPIAIYMSVKYFNKLKSEAVRNRDKEAYVIYQSAKNDALQDFRESLHTNRMAQMMIKKGREVKQQKIADTYFVNSQMVWQ